MSDLVRTTLYDQLEDKVINRVTYDNSAIIDMNARDRADRQGSGKYKGTLVHAARVHMGDIERLKNIGYNLLSDDPEEVKRTLLYIQSQEWKLLSVDGKPFAKKRTSWQ